MPFRLPSRIALPLAPLYPWHPLASTPLILPAPSSSLVHKINITIFALSTSFASLPYPALPCPALPCRTLPCSTLPYPTLPCLGLLTLPGSVIRVKLFQKAYFKMKIFLRLSAKTNVCLVPGGGCSTGCCTGCLRAVVEAVGQGVCVCSHNEINIVCSLSRVV